MKVYTGITIHDGEQVRIVVASKSQKEVAELVGASLYEIRKYWSVTERPVSVEAAMSKPGTMFYSPLRKEPWPDYREMSHDDPASGGM